MKLNSKRFLFVFILCISCVLLSCKSKHENKYYILECEFPNNYKHILKLSLLQYDRKKILLESRTENKGETNLNEFKRDKNHVFGNITNYDHQYPTNGSGSSYDFMSIYYLDGNINNNVYEGIVSKKLLADSVISIYEGAFKIDFNKPIE